MNRQIAFVLAVGALCLAVFSMTGCGKGSSLLSTNTVCGIEFGSYAGGSGYVVNVSTGAVVPTGNYTTPVDSQGVSCSYSIKGSEVIYVGPVGIPPNAL